MNEYAFFDTSAFLAAANSPLDNFPDLMATSTTVLEELENIKTSAHRDEETKQKARTIIKFLSNDPTLCHIVCFKDEMLQPIIDKGFKTVTSDLKILAAAYWFENTEAPDNMVFVTNDLSLGNIANLFFGEDCIYTIEETYDDYKGYKTLILSDEQMAKFYQDLNDNNYLDDCLRNEYLFIKNTDNEIVDTFCFSNGTYRHLSYGNFDSQYFGKVKPMKDDPYQRCAFDSLVNNQITMLKGKPGSGKSLLAMSYLFSQLEKGKIDQIIIFCNTVATKNAARLGYYAGSRDEKLMDSQIGNFLGCKLGSKITVNHLIDTEKLLLLPMSDIRGYDTTGHQAGIYITEAQNMDISLMKLALQRVGNDCKVIIDGDCDTQVDLQAFSGNNNGMRRLSQIFRGQDIYGEMTLEQIHRSRIAAIAENM